MSADSCQLSGSCCWLTLSHRVQPGFDGHRRLRADWALCRLKQKFSYLPIKSRARHIPSPDLRMANGRMGFGGPRRPCLLLSVFLACFLWHTVSSKDIKPRCFTDYDSEVGCFWEVDASTDCPKEFLLHVEATDGLSGQKKSWECSPKNERGRNGTPKCTCTIQNKEVYNFRYHFSLKANGKEIWRMTSKDLRKIGKRSFGLQDPSNA
ncbi:uncharacterized protein LOC132593205 [Zootoca vivipara]|uniref:uncharacterized protein LOC132593205 n=1 Tax=Zootoca vivipara TaxID=8524 RepID=UPI00293BDF37|nr:uncharacterized protein LOC132593205 [Zootoca vivipara]